MNAMDENPQRIEKAELHQVTHVGSPRLTQIVQKALFKRERPAGNMIGDAQAVLLSKLISPADQLFSAHAGGHPMGVRFDGDREANAPVVSAVPTPQLLFEGVKRFVEAQGMTWIARRAAAQF